MKNIVHKISKIFYKKKEEQTKVIQRDFSLYSGERQTVKKLEEVRYDHRARYKVAIKAIKDNFVNSNEKPLFGLDLFCGTGYGSLMLSQAINCNILGIDASSESVDYANQNFSNNRTYFSNKIFPFSLPQESFDFIACFESLEHVEDDINLLREMDKSLKKEGCIILSTPNERCLPFFKDSHSFHYRHYYFEDIIKIVDRNFGWKLINWYGQDLYCLKDSRMESTLPVEEMGLKEQEEGQILIFSFKK